MKMVRDMLRHSRKNNAGFTLVEMITVMVIAGIMFAIGLPMIKGVLQGDKLKFAAQHLSNTLSLARQTAISQRKIIYVYFDTTEKEYWLSDIYPHQPTDLAIGKKHKLPDTVDYITSGSNALPVASGGTYGCYAFKATGAAGYSGASGLNWGTQKNFQIYDTTNTAKVREIKVNNVTGRITVFVP